MTFESKLEVTEKKSLTQTLLSLELAMRDYSLILDGSFESSSRSHEEIFGSNVLSLELSVGMIADVE
jgi:hypothetical protein